MIRTKARKEAPMPMAASTRAIKSTLAGVARGSEAGVEAVGSNGVAATDVDVASMVVPPGPMKTVVVIDDVVSLGLTTTVDERRSVLISKAVPASGTVTTLLAMTVITDVTVGASCLFSFPGMAFNEEVTVKDSVVVPEPGSVIVVVSTTVELIVEVVTGTPCVTVEKMVVVEKTVGIGAAACRLTIKLLAWAQGGSPMTVACGIKCRRLSSDSLL